VAEGLNAFQEAVRAHPIVGRLNAADSMTRLDSDEHLSRSEQWLEDVENSFARQLTTQWKCEVLTIRGKIATRRRDYIAAREQYEGALRLDPGYQDARFQLQALSTPQGGRCLASRIRRLFSFHPKRS
jgi:hypothetical protein